ncbi:MAG: hypothetical protein WCE53_17335 [Candidatus Acidiferrum sp.]
MVSVVSAPTVIATAMVTDVSMSAAVAIVTSAATMKTSCRATVESASTAAVKSPTTATTMTTTLGKGSLWQPEKRDNADDHEKNSQESGFHHFSSPR